jgi:hypothetical protein
VWGGDGGFRSLPYQTLDLTAHFVPASGSSVGVAIEAMHSGGAQALLQLQFHVGGGKVVTVGTDETWSAFNGDVHRNPGKAQHGGSAGTGFIEYIDARREPVGWKSSAFTGSSGWSKATAAPITTAQLAQLHPRMEPPMQTTFVKAASTRHVTPGWWTHLGFATRASNFRLVQECECS